MSSPPTPRLAPKVIVLGLLALSATAPPAEAGGWLHKKGRLVAVPTTTAQVASPVQVLSAMPVQMAQLGVLQVQQAPTMMAAAPMQLSVVQQAAPVQFQAQAAPAPAPSPTIHITVVESAQAQAQAAPTAQAQIQAAPQAAAQSQVQFGAAPPQVVYAAAPVVQQSVSVPQAVPVQLFYIPPTHKCSIFCKH